MLKQQIVDIITLFNGESPDPEVRNRIDKILWENNLLNADSVPQWLTLLFDDILKSNYRGKVYFKYDASKGDTSNFLAELEDIIKADWDDYGEAVKIMAPKIGVEILISSEDNFYEIKKLKSA